MVKSPVFIVGCGHSGTSLLLALLDTHSKICAIPYESALLYKSEQEVKSRLVEFERIRIENKAEMWVEKTPKHIRRIPKIFEIVPDAKVIIMIRDGRDVAYSIKERFGSLKTGYRRWGGDNKYGEKFWHHKNVMVAYYEDLLDYYMWTMGRVFRFLGVAYEDVREFYKKERLYYSKVLKEPESCSGSSHGQFRNWQINQPIHDRRGRWKNLTRDERRSVHNAIGRMLIDYDYVHSAQWIYYE
jgi:hypothetical protein